jgi:ParB family chromosome partitioning protein
MQKKGKGKKPSADASDNDIAQDTAAAPERAELTEPLSNYIELVRHAAVRAALTEAPKTVLRVAVAQLIAGSTHWTIKPEPRRADNSAISEATAKLPADETFRSAQTAAHKLIGKKAADAGAPEDGRIMSPHSYDTHRTVTLYQRLAELGDDDVLKLLTIAVAETLTMGTGLVDALGTDLKVDLLKDWQRDDTLLLSSATRTPCPRCLARSRGSRPPTPTSPPPAPGRRRSSATRSTARTARRRKAGSRAGWHSRKANTPSAR